MKNTREFHVVTNKLRAFFLDKGFIEVPAQSRLSILAACEDPKTVSTMQMTGQTWPLPQTGQMWLERELLENPKWKGAFCSTTSYRDEPNPIPGRHERVFPMFEFESHGSIEELKKIEIELLQYLGFEAPITKDYEDLAKHYNAPLLEIEHEDKMCNEFAKGILLQNFPERTHPFWNMKHAGNGIYSKVDLILYGQETIGSAERSCNVQEMRDTFYTIENGAYAELLFTKFGKERVIAELDDFLSYDFFPRFGGGVGVTRLASAMRAADLLDHKEEISFTGAFKTSVDQLSV